MSIRRRPYGLFVALVAAGLVGSTGALGVSACSSSTDDAPAPAPGTEAGPDVRITVDGGPEEDGSKPETVAECEAKCNVKFPTAQAKVDIIDKCWDDNCAAPCVDQSGGFDAGEAGVPDAGDGGTVCGTEILSGVDTRCDQCTETFCCTSWRGCYADPDCNAYNSCLIDCDPNPDPEP
jgi:hypothetical protein